jgi:hypothetical protein
MPMDTTDSTYIVGWIVSGETEVTASSPEEAARKAKRQARAIYKPFNDTKLRTVKTEFAIPANE